jgi:hypothetical protein
MTLSREPARPHDPGYPTFSEFDPGRRAALRAIGLAGLSAVGLQLVSCTGGGTSPPPSGTDTKPPAPDTEWVPWRDPENGPDAPLAGAEAPYEPEQPVAVVVGDGPIDVVFSDGRQAKLAVALVVQRGTLVGGVNADAPEHPAAVKAAARSLPGSTVDTAEGLDALGARIRDEVLKATPGLVLEGVQVAPAREPGSEEPAPAPARSADAAEPAGEARSSAAAAPSKRGKPPLTGKQVWVPCRRPGCTSCGK